MGRENNRRKGLATISTYREFERAAGYVGENRSIVIIALIQSREGKRKVLVRTDVDVIYIENLRGASDINNGSTRNFVLFIVSRKIATLDIANRCIAAIRNPCLIKRATALPAGIISNFRLRGRQSTVRTAILAVKSIAGRHIVVALHNLDRSLPLQGNTLERGISSQRKFGSTFRRSLSERKGQRRGAGFARHGAGRAPLRVARVFERQIPVAFRNDLYRLFELASRKFTGDGHDLAAVHGNFGHSRITVVVIVRACSEGCNCQHRAEQCFPEIYYFHRVEC